MKRFLRCLMVLVLVCPFFIGSAAPALADQYVEPLAPEAGDILYSGDMASIMWQNGLLTNKVSISFSSDNGASYTVVQENISATTNSAQSIAWLVPVADSSQCKLKFHYEWFFMGSTNQGDSYSESFEIKSYRSPMNLHAEALSEDSIKLNWDDNGTDEDCYRIERKDPVNDWAVIQWELPANTEEYVDTGLISGTTYDYKVYGIKYDSAHQAHYDGDPTNIASATTKALVQLAELPGPPTTLTASATSEGKIELAWEDNADNETGFKIFRQIDSTGTMQLLDTVAANITAYTDSDTMVGSTYYYQVCATNAAGDSDYSNVASVVITGNQNHQAATVLKYYIGNLQYLVNDQPAFLDSAPVVMENRILLPIRFVVDPLGGTAAWNNDTKQATVNCNGHTIVLTLNSNNAVVDGVSQQIDPDNASVMPQAIDNRILMPLRFVGESLDCGVAWNQVPQEAVLTYPESPTATII